MRILGIETSADETSAAVVVNGSKLLSNVTQSQIELHKIYGGIVPEVSARSHIEVILPVIDQAITQADTNWDEIDAVAVTYAPGLIGSLLIGTLAARTLALVKNKPLYPIHHVKAHVYANFIEPEKRSSELSRAKAKRRNAADVQSLTSAKWPLPGNVPETDMWQPPKFPLLALIVSGGHSQLVLFQSHQEYEILGRTQDDAVGEAFDKVAKILGLPYPGGPSVAKAAEKGNADKYKLPKSKLTGAFDFSFSGLKTATLRAVQKEAGKDFTYPSHQLSPLLSEQQINDFAASFQKTAVETLVDKTLLAYKRYSPAFVVIAGGVAANQELRCQLSKRLPVKIDYPPLSLCTDNAAMIAACAYYQSQFEEPVDPRALEVTSSLSM